MTKNESLWSGRINSPIAADFADYQASLSFDQRLVDQDIRGSLAHVRMLVATNILSIVEGETICTALEGIGVMLAKDIAQLPVGCEDIHSAVESLLRDRIGPLAGKVHTARSRNDQVATDFRLYVKEALNGLCSLLRNLRTSLLDEAQKHLTSDDGSPAVLPGYTHLQVAQPIHLSHWFMAYFEMFTRDEDRLRTALARMDECPLGSCALAGTSWPIDRHQTARELGFGVPMRNSLDAVSSRDFVFDFSSACSMLLVNLSRMSEDLIIYSTVEFGFVTMPNAFATGSSIMPQKKNPDLCELTRAKTGRVFGHLMSILTVMKGLPLAYNKDLQEDKEAVFDTVNTVIPLLTLWQQFLPQLNWNVSNCRNRAAAGFSGATDLADELARLGVPFREAHKAVGALVTHCLQKGLGFEALTPEELCTFHPHLTPDLVAKARLEQVIERRVSFGGSSTNLISAAIKAARTSSSM